jgi:hypothetical protein
MRAPFLALTALAITGPRQAQAAPITSAYTTLDLGRCARIDTGNEEQSATWRCKGHAGIPLIVQAGDDRYDLDAGREDRDEFWGQAFDYPGRTVEWRLRRGRPFAVIYRLNSSGDGALKRSRLIVETVGRSVAGCRIAEIDGARLGANEEARRIADRVADGTAPCLVAKGR